MAEKMKIYKCEICGNIVVVLHEGKGELVCCGEPMKELDEKVQEEGNEKHLPVIEDLGRGITIKVGSILHPMEEKHHIEWIEVVTKDGRVSLKFLEAGDSPRADFKISYNDISYVREHCNIHGLWKTKV